LRNVQKMDDQEFLREREHQLDYSTHQALLEPEVLIPNREKPGLQPHDLQEMWLRVLLDVFREVE
jgi:hypothetical protein